MTSAARLDVVVSIVSMRGRTLQRESSLRFVGRDPFASTGRVLGPMKNFVFTLTTGRSGTKYLAELLGQNLPRAECHHEICGWDRLGVDTPDVSHMTLFNSQGNVDKVRSFWQSKLARVAATPQAWYVETSHLLMKAGLVENLALLTETGTVHLIALERDPYATIVSFRNRFDFWGKADRWLWYLDPEYPKNLVPSRELFAKGINGCVSGTSWKSVRAPRATSTCSSASRAFGSIASASRNCGCQAAPRGCCRLSAIPRIRPRCGSRRRRTWAGCWSGSTPRKRHRSGSSSHRQDWIRLRLHADPGSHRPCAKA
jgi:hypothetical protein